MVQVRTTHRLVLAFSLLLCSSVVAAGKAAIASAHHLATAAGFEILDRGGNAFDAAVAVSAALAVVEPASSGLGGGGFWLLRIAAEDRYVFVDGRERAPGAATADMYLDEAGEVNRDLAVNGPLAAGIPGHPAALVHLADKYGELPLAESLAPAIRLAQSGFPVDSKYRLLMGFRADVVRRYPAASSTLLVDDEVPEEGAIIVQPDLAETLQAMAARWFDGFYGGEVAQKLVDGVRADGGIWTLQDLADYRIVERQPMTFDYAGYRVITAPPPSSGGVALATMLNVLSGYDLSALDETTKTHLTVEAMRRAYRDRGKYLGDPDFVDMPIQRLTHPYYAAGLRAAIRHDKATSSSALPGIADTPGGTDTTHFSLADDQGNYVSATMSVNLPYGSGYIAPGTGVILNNEMDDFSAKAGDPNAYGLLGEDANKIAPGKRMLSSMTPTIMVGDERTAILGTPGGSRIITMVLLGMLEFIDGGDPDAIVNRPRFHHQYMPDEISYEPGALPTAMIEALESMGHALQDRGRSWGNMHAVTIDHRRGELAAASDQRNPSGTGEVREVGGG